MIGKPSEIERGGHFGGIKSGCLLVWVPAGYLRDEASWDDVRAIPRSVPRPFLLLLSRYVELTESSQVANSARLWACTYIREEGIYRIQRQVFRSLHGEED